MGNKNEISSFYMFQLNLPDEGRFKQQVQASTNASYEMLVYTRISGLLAEVDNTIRNDNRKIRKRTLTKKVDVDTINRTLHK